jgi:hypothetical protein
MNTDAAVQRLAEVVRRKHLTLATERTCCAWFRRYCDFLKGLPLRMPNEHKLERFLTALAQNNVAASTQNQASNGIIPMGQWAENPKRGVLGVPNLQFHRSMESGAGAHALQDLPAHRSRPVNAKRRGVRNASSALAVHPTPSANSCRRSAFPAAKTAFPPNYFHFCKSAFLGAKPLLPGLYKGFFEVATSLFRPAFCTHGGQSLFQTCGLIVP